MICIIWISQQAHVFAPGVSYAAWAVIFALMFTALNVQGVKTSARVNTALAVGMGVVIAIFFVAAARYIFGHPHDGAAFFTRPFYDPASWNTKAVLGGTSVAVLTYIGFDGISTLSEEAENPRRNILLATVLVCVVIGILSAFQVYAAQLIWPASEPFPNMDTAFTFVAGRAWAPLFAIVGFTLAGGELRLGHGRADWARRGCSMEWDAATLYRSRSLVRSTPNGTCHATMSCLWVRSPWPERFCFRRWPEQPPAMILVRTCLISAH